MAFLFGVLLHYKSRQRDQELLTADDWLKDAFELRYPKASFLSESGLVRCEKIVTACAKFVTKSPMSH